MEQDGDEEGEGADTSKPLSSGAQGNRKWLKEVTLKKVQVCSKKSSGDLTESHTPPFLSAYEKDGLLGLVQQMLKTDLFVPDAPPNYTNPKEMLMELQEQLRSPNMEKICAMRPTGVGVVSPLTSKRTRASIKPRKRRREIDETNETSLEGMKVQKKGTPTMKLKATAKRKRKQKPLVVSVPVSLMSPATPDWVGEEKGVAILDSNITDPDSGNGAGRVAETHNNESVSMMEERPVEGKECTKLETDGGHLVRSDSEEDDEAIVCEPGVVMTRLLTPPLSLSSADSRSPSPSHTLPSSPSTPSSQSFRLILELDSPLSSSSQTTPLLSCQQQNHTHNTAQTLEEFRTRTPESSTAPMVVRDPPGERDTTTTSHLSV